MRSAGSVHQQIQRQCADTGRFWAEDLDDHRVSTDVYLPGGGGYCDLVVYASGSWRQDDPIILAEVKPHIRGPAAMFKAVNQARRYRQWFIDKHAVRPRAYIVCPEVAPDLDVPADVTLMTPHEFAVPLGEALRGIQP